MKKYMIAILLMTMGTVHAQESFSNHAFRMYGSVGFGLPLFNAGGGFSYAYEFGKSNSATFAGISIDTQVGAAGLVPGIYFNIQSSFGVGRHYKDGGRFFFDIIGVGFSLIHEEQSAINFDGAMFNTVRIGVTGIGALINLLSFHHTSKSGFYFSWRNNLSLFNTGSVKYSDGYNDLNVSDINVVGFMYSSYFTFGFDFSKKYNSKIYEPRLF